MVTSTLVTASLGASIGLLEHVSYIWYLVQFQESQSIRALIDSQSEINAMTLAYVAKLDLTSQKINVGAQKMDGSPLETHDMASAVFSLQDNLKKV